MTEAINLNRLAYFAAVVEAGSFTRAAERLGVTKTVVSQQVARLEAEAGTSLLVRSTRRVEPTEAGRMLHARCVLILQEADDAFGELAEANAEPRGTLRITAPNDFGFCIVSAVVAEFVARYESCRVDLILTDSKLDLLQNQIDLSIRVGWLEDSSLQARRIAAFRQLCVASPQLAAKHAAKVPEDLALWPFVANAALKEPNLWHFSRGDLERQTVRTKTTMSTNTTPATWAATRVGAGFSIFPDYLVTDDLRTGKLVQLLPEWSLPSGGIYAVYPAARFRPPKVTTFVTMLTEEIRRRENIGACA